MGAVRRDLRAIAEGGTGDSFAGLADAGRSVDAMIAFAEQQVMPGRLVLGSTAFDNIDATLRARLSELEAQREVALAAD